MAPISLGDPRLACQYAGPDDPAFRRETLLRVCDYAGDMSIGTVSLALDALRLHRQATAAEAASRCMALLDSGKRYTKELAVLAHLLGRDRESRRVTGLAPRAACEAAFKDEFIALEAKKKEALEEASPLSLVALGDAARLAEVLAAGASLEVKDDPRGGDDSSGRLARLRRLLQEMAGANLDSERDAAAPGEEANGRLGGEADATEDESDWETASVHDLQTVEEEGGEEEPEGSASGSEHGSAPGGPEAGGALHRMESLLAGRRRSVTGTPLHLAAANSITACIPVLLEEAERRGGKDGLLNFLIAADGEMGRTALHYAVCTGSEDTIKVLLRAGASSKIQDENGETPLHVAVLAAAQQREPWRLQVLLCEAQDLEPNLFNRDGEAALHLAIVTGDIDIVMDLLEHGVDVNAKGGAEGMTPLHTAVEREDFDAVELLLEHGADPGVRNHNNDTPGELAEALGLEEVASLLRQRQQLKRLMSSTSGRRLNHSLSSRSSPAVDEVPADEACIICLERPKAVILAPCGHRCTCKRCTRAVLMGARERRSCPLCKEAIESFVTRVFE